MNGSKFTVKQVLNDGSVQFFQTAYVFYQPHGYGDAEVLWVDGDNAAERVPLHQGSIYVMNEWGRTVDRFHFGPSLEPSEEIKPREVR